MSLEQTLVANSKEVINIVIICKVIFFTFRNNYSRSVSASTPAKIPIIIF